MSINQFIDKNIDEINRSESWVNLQVNNLKVNNLKTSSINNINFPFDYAEIRVDATQFAGNIYELPIFLGNILFNDVVYNNSSKYTLQPSGRITVNNVTSEEFHILTFDIVASVTISDTFNTISVSYGGAVQSIYKTLKTNAGVANDFTSLSFTKIIRVTDLQNEIDILTSKNDGSGRIQVTNTTGGCRITIRRLS